MMMKHSGYKAHKGSFWLLRKAVAVLSLACVVLIAAPIHNAYAACTSPASPEGGLQYFSAGDQEYKYCDGASWIAWGGGVSGAAPGANREIVYNSGGSFHADNAFTFTSANRLVFSSGNNVFISGGNDTITGTNNTALGNAAFAANTTGTRNVAIGRSALTSNTTGIHNSASGYQALNSNTVGEKNTAMGYQALKFNVAKSHSTAVGYRAMFYADDTTTVSNANNTALGYQALRGSTTSANNTGVKNTALGMQTLLNNTSGSNNVAIGYLAGDLNTTGSDNILIGYNVDAPLATTNEYLNIGNLLYGDIGTTSTDPKIGTAKYCDENLANCFVATDVGGGAGLWTSGAGDIIYYNSGSPLVGIGTITPDVELDVIGDIEYTGTITDVSDRRLKTNIVPLTERGAMLAKVIAVDTYSFRMKDDVDTRTEFGVMAQELEGIFPTLVHTAIDEMGTKSVNYVGLIAPMIEATKELKAENDALRAEMAAMKTERDDMHAAFDDLKRDVNGLKAHTGYGVSKAQMMGFGVLVTVMVGGALLFFLFGGAGVIVRRRAEKISEK